MKNVEVQNSRKRNKITHFNKAYLKTLLYVIDFSLKLTQYFHSCDVTTCAILLFQFHIT